MENKKGSDADNSETDDIIDYYEILGVSQDSSLDVIKKAYRKLQLKYHPDRNVGNDQSEKMCKKINEAYEVIGNEQSRQVYDRRNRMDECGNIDDLFRTLFGGGFGHSFNGPNHPSNSFNHPSLNNLSHLPAFVRMHHDHGSEEPASFFDMCKPESIHCDLWISMDHVFNGSQLPIHVTRQDMGKEIKETIYVKIEPGMDEDEIIVLPNRGHCRRFNNSLVKGDVKVRIRIKNESPFVRHGLDLIFEKTITLKESLCGFSFELDHLNGKKYIMQNIHGCVTAHGFRKCYPGFGLSRNSHVGELWIQFSVQFPEKMTDTQIAELSAIFESSAV